MFGGNSSWKKNKGKDLDHLFWWGQITTVKFNHVYDVIVEGETQLISNHKHSNCITNRTLWSNMIICIVICRITQEIHLVTVYTMGLILFKILIK